MGEQLNGLFGLKNILVNGVEKVFRQTWNFIGDGWDFSEGVDDKNRKTVEVRFTSSGGGGTTLVASFFDADVVDMTTEPALNGLFYTVPTGGEGWYRMHVALRSVASVNGSCSLQAFLGGAAITLDTPRVEPIWEVGPGGEGTQAANRQSPADMYLLDGEAIRLSSFDGAHIAVGVRLELVSLRSALEA